MGAPAADPEKFVAAVLHRDQGQLAWLFDTVGRMGGSQQAFVVGRSRTGLRSLHPSFAGFDDRWAVSKTPFRRLARLDASFGSGAYPDNPKLGFGQFTKAAPPFQAQAGVKLSF